jgi:hypothetical protein
VYSIDFQLFQYLTELVAFLVSININASYSSGPIVD